MTLSLQIQTERWDITLEGTNRASIWDGLGVSQPPRLRVHTDFHDRIEIISTDGESQPGSGCRYEGAGSQIFEETNYRLSVVSRRGVKPFLTHLDPSLIRDVRTIPGRDDVVSGNLNFRSQIGESRFVVSDSESTTEFIIEVRPSKLDYETDYEDLLLAVGGLARQLLLEFLRATTRGAEAETTNNNRQIEWLLLLREEIDSLEQALKYIVDNPYKLLARETGMIRAGRIRRPAAATRKAIARGLGQGAWEVTAEIGRHRARLLASQPYETLDNPENRWLRAQLERATRSLSQLRLDFEASQRPRQGKKTNPRAQAVVNELATMEQVLAPFLKMSPFTDASSLIPSSFASLALQGRPGYREAYLALLRLNMALRVGGAALDIPIRDLSELYEIWCFLAVVHRVSGVLGKPVEVFDLIELRDNGLRLMVVPGQQSTVRVKAEWCEARVTYNRTYQMSSGAQRPDIEVEIRREGVPPVLLLLDAKYRLDTTLEYVNDFRSPGPPTDAVGQLHRYRDAIVVKYPKYPLGRPVVRAVALFPLGAAQSQAWINHPFYAAIGEVGIGALPFLPSNTDWVDEWLRQGMTASPSQLAWPGPDFIAWAELTRQQP